MTQHTFQRGATFDRFALATAEEWLVENVRLKIGHSLILRRFLAFHHNNPRVFDLLLRFAREIQHTNRRRFGMKALFERVRWELALTTTEDTGLKLNNNYTAYYARLLALFDPSLADFFTTRALGPRNRQVV